jgi:uncharacterized protein (TIGR03067 family)
LEFLSEETRSIPDIALGFARTRSIKRRIAMILDGTAKNPLSFRMRAALVAIGAFLLGGTVDFLQASAENDPVPAKQKDADPLQGTWTAVHFERAGREFPKEILEQGRHKVVIKGDTLRMTDGKRGEGATFKRDSTKNPHTIDLVFMEGEKEDIKRTALGIYEIDGDNLKFAWRKDGGKRPTKFVSIPDERTSELVILKRDKSK